MSAPQFDPRGEFERFLAARIPDASFTRDASGEGYEAPGVDGEWKAWRAGLEAALQRIRNPRPMSPEEWANTPARPVPDHIPAPTLHLVASREDMEKVLDSIAPRGVWSTPMAPGYSAARVQGLQDFETRQAFKNWARGRYGKTWTLDDKADGSGFAFGRAQEEFTAWQAAAEWERSRQAQRGRAVVAPEEFVTECGHLEFSENIGVAYCKKCHRHVALRSQAGGEG